MIHLKKKFNNPYCFLSFLNRPVLSVPKIQTQRFEVDLSFLARGPLKQFPDILYCIRVSDLTPCRGTSLSIINVPRLLWLYSQYFKKGTSGSIVATHANGPKIQSHIYLTWKLVRRHLRWTRARNPKVCWQHRKHVSCISLAAEWPSNCC